MQIAPTRHDARGSSTRRGAAARGEASVTKGTKTMKQATAYAFILGLTLAGPARPAAPLGCLIEPDKVAEVGSPMVGVIESMNVERGDRVAKGQPIAVLRADVERAQVSVAQSKADAEADVQAAQASVEFNRQRAVRAEDLFQKKFISQQALDQARTEADIADQKLAQAREQRRIWQRELGLASAQLSQRTIRSPIDGVIAERYLSPGERVEEKPLVRVARVDPLKVQVVVPTAQYGRIAVGGSAMVMPELPGAAPAQARVSLVDKVIDAASNTFRVHLELPNPDLRLPAGLRCKVDFGIDMPPLVRPTRQTLPETGAATQPAVLKLDSRLPNPRPAGAASARPGT